jgi:ribosome-binding protein aMBF1 (putative translation factor)
MMTLDEITKARIARQMSRRGLAKKADVSDVHVLLCERGERVPSKKLLHKLSQAVRSKR